MDEGLSSHIVALLAQLFLKYLNTNPSIEVLLSSWHLILLEENIKIVTKASVQYQPFLFQALKSLIRLPIHVRSGFKVLLMPYKSVKWHTISYPCDLLKLYILAVLSDLRIQGSCLSPELKRKSRMPSPLCTLSLKYPTVPVDTRLCWGPLKPHFNLICTLSVASSLIASGLKHVSCYLV